MPVLAAIPAQNSRCGRHRGPANAAGADLRVRLRAALDDALRMQSSVALYALRSALSAIANAEAVSPPPAVATASSSHIAAAVAGVGVGEGRRRDLSAAELDELVQAEISERQQAASRYDRTAHCDLALRLRAEASVLAAVLSGESAQHDAPSGRLTAGDPEELRSQSNP